MAVKLLFLRRAIIGVCLTVLLQVGSKAQNYASTLEGTAGYAQDGFAFNIGYNYYLDRVQYVQGALFMSFANDKVDGLSVPYNNFTLNIGYFREIYRSPRKSWLLAIGGGGLVGYEVVNNGRERLDNGAVIDADSKFLYGLFIGAEIDVYLSDSWSITGKVNEYWHPPSDLGQFVFYGGIGVKYYLF